MGVNVYMAYLILVRIAIFATFKLPSMYSSDNDRAKTQAQSKYRGIARYKSTTNFGLLSIYFHTTDAVRSADVWGC